MNRFRSVLLLALGSILTSPERPAWPTLIRSAGTSQMLTYEGDLIKLLSMSPSAVKRQTGCAIESFPMKETGEWWHKTTFFKTPQIPEVLLLVQQASKSPLRLSKDSQSTLFCYWIEKKSHAESFASVGLKFSDWRKRSGNHPIDSYVSNKFPKLLIEVTAAPFDWFNEPPKNEGIITWGMAIQRLPKQVK